MQAWASGLYITGSHMCVYGPLWWPVNSHHGGADTAINIGLHAFLYLMKCPHYKFNGTRDIHSWAILVYVYV